MEYPRPKVDLPKRFIIIKAIRLPRPDFTTPRATKNATTINRINPLEKPKNAIVLRVDPGTFSVPHCDRFKHALRNSPELTLDDIVRLWIPLEDSEFGDAFFVGDSVLHKWRAGEVYTFDNYTIHSAANAGLHTRYTLIVYTNKTKKG